jgi:hypothetical protein
MLNAASLIKTFQFLTLAGSALTVLKLFSTGLYRRYRMFFLLFLFQIPNTLWPLFINTNSDLYLHLWEFTEPVTWLLYVLVVLELYRLVLENHKGLYSLGRWIMYGAILVAVFLSFLSLLPHFSPTTPQLSRMLNYFFAAERGVDFSLAIFIFLILLFLSRYPVPLSRNVLVHTGLYSVYFLSGTVGMLLLSARGYDANVKINVFFTGMSSVCAFAWFFLLTRKGEEGQATLPFYSIEYERRALEQLDALNATLLKISRK